MTLTKKSTEIVQWIDENSFKINDFKFFLSPSPKDGITIKKGKSFILNYISFFNYLQSQNKKTSNVIELGILWGGSAIFINELFSPQKLICIDLHNKTLPFYENYINSNKGNNIKSFFGINQADIVELQKIIFSEDINQLDMVVDDASHFYNETKASFNAFFPHLRAGGIYVIEDWGWAHWPEFWQRPDAPWQSQLSMANILLELSALLASNKNLISRIEINYEHIMVIKGTAQCDTSFSLENAYLYRGKKFHPQ